MKKLFTRYEKVTTDLGKIYGKEDKAKALNDELDKNCRYEKRTAKTDKSLMYLLVNEGELSTFGPGGRFGDLLFNTLDLNRQINMLKQVHMVKILIMNI